MLGLFTIALIATGLSRLARAPRSLIFGIWGGFAGFAGLIVANDPPDAATLERWGWTVVGLGAIALPILGYAHVVRSLRRRASPAPAVPGADAVAEPGFVVIEDDAALMREVARRLATECGPKDTFSVAYRDADRNVIAAGQARIRGPLAEWRRVWVVDEQRRKGMGRRLVAELEAAARARNARHATVTCDVAEQVGFWTRLDYSAYGTIPGTGAPRRIHLGKDLS